MSKCLFELFLLIIICAFKVIDGKQLTEKVYADRCSLVENANGLLWDYDTFNGGCTLKCVVIFGTQSSFEGAVFADGSYEYMYGFNSDYQCGSRGICEKGQCVEPELITTNEPTFLADMFDFTNIIENSTNKINLIDPQSNINSSTTREARLSRISTTSQAMTTRAMTTKLETIAQTSAATTESTHNYLITGSNNGYRASIEVLNGYFPYRDVTTKDDPFIEIWCDMRDISTTPVRKNTHYPHFDYKTDLGHVTRDSVIKLYVWDEDPYKNDYYGNIYIYVSNILDQGLNGTAIGINAVNDVEKKLNTFDVSLKKIHDDNEGNWLLQINWSNEIGYIFQNPVDRVVSFVPMASKVLDRFGGFYPTQRIRVLFPSILSTRNENAMAQFMYDLQVQYFQKLNFTEVYSPGLSVGYPVDSYGNYSGMIGILQRDEADCAAHMVRTDSLQYEPVRMGAPLIAADVAIMTVSANISESDVDVLDVVKNVDEITYGFTSVAVLLMVVWFVALRFNLSRWTLGKKLYKMIWSQTVMILWHSFCLMVDQENLRLKSVRRRILWHHFVSFSNVAIFGYFLNLMSTDLVVKTKPDTIDSIEDHLEQRFNHVEPLVLKDMHYFSLMQQSPPASPIGRLYQRAVRGDGLRNNVYKANPESPESVLSDSLRILDEYQTGNRSLLLQQAFVEKLGKQTMCLVRPKLAERIQIARKTFGHGFLSGFFTKRLEGQLRSFIEYRYQTSFEFGRPMESIREAGHMFAKTYMFPVDWNVTKCEQKTQEEEVDEPRLWLYVLRKTFNMYFATAALATVCFIVELAIGQTGVKVIPRKSWVEGINVADENGYF